MKISELIARLHSFNPDTEIMIRTGFSGGAPRTINTGPLFTMLTQSDADEAAECKCRVGEGVVILGYGSYA